MRRWSGIYFGEKGWRKQRESEADLEQASSLSQHLRGSASQALKTEMSL